VRGCVACRDRPGPSKSREEHNHWASPITSRTTAGQAKDRRGGGDVRGSPGLRHRVMIRRDRQWARTRMRSYTAQFKNAVCRGFKPCNGSIERRATLVAHHVQLQFHTFVYLRPVSVSWDLAALISQRPPIASQGGHQPVKRASSVRCINQR
jgi:hypothetical protein